MEASKEEQRGVVHFLVAKDAATHHKVKIPWNAAGQNHPLHDNARVHTANLVRDKLQRYGWETLQHPSYSPDISPCDFHIFGNLKDICGHWFHSDKEVQDWMRLWIHQRPTSFYKTGIDHHVSQWDKCVNTSGNYF